jgi:hypothetical protein
MMEGEGKCGGKGAQRFEGIIKDEREKCRGGGARRIDRR